MKLLSILFILLFPFATCTHAKEFEGVITYNISVEVINKAFKEKKIVKGSGTIAQFYFKKGKHRWADDTKMEFQVYNSQDDPEDIVYKMRKNDTLFYILVVDLGHSISKITTLPQTTICGVKCAAAQFSIINDNDDLIAKRTLYYPVDSLQYDKPYYSKYNYLSEDSITMYCGSIPLRLELEYPRAYKLSFEAIKIEWKALDDALFVMDRRAPKARK
jgi:hypothetical protein